MEQGQTIELSQPDLHKVIVYIADTKEESQAYKDKYGGIIFHDIGINKYWVFPDAKKDYSGSYYSISEH